MPIGLQQCNVGITDWEVRLYVILPKNALKRLWNNDDANRFR